MSVGFVLLLLIYLPLLLLAGSQPRAAAGFAWILLIIIGYFFGWLFFAYNWLEIFLHIDSYSFCQAKLDQPHIEGRGGASFTVEFTDRRGKVLKRDTSSMFSSQREPFLEDYNNKTVLIGYNEETDRVVVIERVNA